MSLDLSNEVFKMKVLGEVKKKMSEVFGLKDSLVTSIRKPMGPLRSEVCMKASRRITNSMFSTGMRKHSMKIVLANIGCVANQRGVKKYVTEMMSKIDSSHDEETKSEIVNAFVQMAYDGSGLSTTRETEMKEIVRKSIARATDHMTFNAIECPTCKKVSMTVTVENKASQGSAGGKSNVVSTSRCSMCGYIEIM